MKNELRIGKEFEIGAVIIDAETRQIEVKAKNRIAMGLLAFSALAIFVGGYLAIQTGNSSALSKTWAVVAMPVGAIIAHYFGERRNDRKDDNQSSG